MNQLEEDYLRDELRAAHEREDELRAACAAMQTLLDTLFCLADVRACVTTKTLSAIKRVLEQDHGRAFLAKHKRMEEALTQIRDNAGQMMMHHIVEIAQAALQDTETNND